mmetsp:Transcript_63250/g.142644  ORF Transcript_63250/g.142644 Transcript_63250/m.142644 type:complete len:238 (-) Transcript_63250:1938-2651(-)
MPSRPAMPMPMLAARIIGTSFAPSPMPRDRMVGTYFLTSRTMRAFCSGDERQTTTETHWVARATNLSAGEWQTRAPSWLPSMMKLRVPPSMTSPFFWPSLLNTASERHVSRRWFTSASELLLTMKSFIEPVRRLVDLPISMAVSCLSPVRTQRLILARARRTMVSGTFCWSLSSTAVQPTRFMPLSSTSLARSSNLASRSAGGRRVAPSHSSAQRLCSSMEMVLEEKHSVRRPSIEK